MLLAEQRRIGSLKAELVRRLLRDEQRAVLLMDTDVVFLRDPRSFLSQDSTVKVHWNLFVSFC